MNASETGSFFLVAVERLTASRVRNSARIRESILAKILNKIASKYFSLSYKVIWRESVDSCKIPPGPIQMDSRTWSRISDPESLFIYCLFIYLYFITGIHTCGQISIYNGGKKHHHIV